MIIHTKVFANSADWFAYSSSKDQQKKALRAVSLIESIPALTSKKDRRLIAKDIALYYPLLGSFMRGNGIVSQAVQESLHSFYGLLDKDLQIFARGNTMLPARLSQRNFAALADALSNTGFDFRKNILALTLLITNNYGMNTDLAAYQYYSMDNAVLDYMTDYFSPATVDFANFALNNSNVIQSFYNGELAESVFTQMLQNLQQYAKQDPRFYYLFLLLNIINAHIPAKDYINNATALYYSQLFDVQQFLQQGIKLFKHDLPLERIQRLQPGLDPQNINKNFQKLNVFNLHLLLNPGENQYHKAIPLNLQERFLNYLCSLNSQLGGNKVIILDTVNSMEALQELCNDLKTRLEIYTFADFLDTKTGTFLGYRYFPNDEYGYVRIYMLD